MHEESMVCAGVEVFGDNFVVPFFVSLFSDVCNIG